MVKLQKFDKHLVAEQSSVSAKPCFETAKNKRDPLLHLNHFLHHMASIQVFLVIKKWWKPSPKRHKCSPPGILECNFNNRVSTMCMFPAYSVCWQKQWICLKRQKTCWLSISSSTSSGYPPRVQTRYSMASSMTTLRRCGASIIWCQQKIVNLHWSLLYPKLSGNQHPLPMVAEQFQGRPESSTTTIHYKSRDWNDRDEWDWPTLTYHIFWNKFQTFLLDTS